ncbi:hypothetical protein HLH35_15150 [Gluconacetobacter asukensis]|uniref:N-acetyltransferase domain-containing protein n=2 Tax=Gluconacetobacter asukensis TaxID=1017181 RepID=A0A7W4J2G5_9PROT|nr:hypothetical protein [Gluconacetobacter asukensis]
MGYSAAAFADASEVPVARRSEMMEEMNAIIAKNWILYEPHWTSSRTPFEREFGIILLYFHNKIIAFSVYKRFRIGGMLALYRSGSEVLPQHQGRGLYHFLTATSIELTASDLQPEESEILYAWRTRNPIIWAANSKICSRLVPSLHDGVEDGELQEAATEICGALYPGQILETPAMIMRGCYDHIIHRGQKSRGTVAMIQDVIEREIPDPRDALFSVGIVRL